MSSACAHGSDDVFVRLRAATAADHASVEASLALLDPVLPSARLRAVLERLHGFHAATEEALDGWAVTAPAPAWLEWPARRKRHLVESDLRALGLTPRDVAALPPMPAAGAVAGTADALGRLYVVEGSTLGGRLIGRHLARVAGLPSVPAVFDPYGTATGRRWHAFRAGTRAWVGDCPQRRDAVVTAATATFGALAAWCRPLAAGHAA